MATEPDARDDPAERDPVVRMPKRMYMAPPAPEPEGPGARLVLLVALVGAAVGALLGAVGLAIVWTTWKEPPRPPVVAAAASARAAGGACADPDAGPDAAASFALALDAGVAAEVPTVAPDLYEIAQQPLGRGRPLANVLRALHLSPVEAQAVVRVLQAQVNMRTLQPADRVLVMRDRERHEVQRVEYRREAAQIWAAVRRGAAWRAERVEVVMTSERVVRGFRVRGSVEGSMQAAGLHAELAARLAEVFPALSLPPRLLADDVVRVAVDEERMNGQFYRYGRVHAVDYRGAYGHRRAFWVGVAGARSDFFDADGNTFPRGPLRSPVPGARVTSLFNPRRMHPVLHVIKPHNGVDFAAPMGTPVYAAAEGAVASAGAAGPSGNLVLVSHPALRIQTGYAHLSRVAPGMRPGARLHAGQLVGWVGTTGRSTGPHLHFSAKRAAAFFDPLSLMGLRRSIAQTSRLYFETQSRQFGAELDRVAVDGETLSGAAPPTEVLDADARARPTLAPLEVSRGGVDSELEEPAGEGADPLDEGEAAW